MRGGLPSGHAAIAFAGWMAATHILDDSRHRFLISSLTFILALLVAQTRVESGVHSSLEVAYGGMLGALVTLVVFQVFAVTARSSSPAPPGRGSRLLAVLGVQGRRCGAHARRQACSTG